MINTTQLAKKYNIDRSWLAELCRNKKITAKRGHRNNWLIDESSFLFWYKNQYRYRGRTKQQQQGKWWLKWEKEKLKKGELPKTRKLTAIAAKQWRDENKK